MPTPNDLKLFLLAWVWKFLSNGTRTTSFGVHLLGQLSNDISEDFDVVLFLFFGSDFIPDVAIDSESYPAVEGKPLADLKLRQPLETPWMFILLNASHTSYAFCCWSSACLLSATSGTPPHSWDVGRGYRLSRWNGGTMPVYSFLPLVIFFFRWLLPLRV